MYTPFHKFPLLVLAVLYLVECLPRGECCAVGRADHHERLVTSHHLQSFVSFPAFGKVPRVIVLWITDCQIQGEAWYEVLEPFLLA